MFPSLQTLSINDANGVIPRHSIFYEEEDDTPLVNTTDIGARFNVFQSMKPATAPFQTAVYVYSINPTTNEPHFAFGRKIPAGTRVPVGYRRANPTMSRAAVPARFLTGAAGTERRYWGKWASLGGGADRTAQSPLQAAVIELNDEAAIQPPIDSRTQVWVPWAGGAKPANSRLILVHADRPGGTGSFYSFVFKMRWTEFTGYFPHVDDQANVRGGPLSTLPMNSHGEIDYTASFTVQDMVRYQSIARAATTPNNFFTRYTLATMQSQVARAVNDNIQQFPAGGVQQANITPLLQLPLHPDVTDRVAVGWRNPPNLRYG
tara:strand:- start:731 stop:1687 length:957 start_codon:yes stop_codon:yes gene_type:complete